MLKSFFVIALTLLSAAFTATAAEQAATPERQSWSFAGVNGKYDQDQLRRGLQIYSEKCRACHGMAYLDFRSLTRPGGPQLSVEAARELASGYVFADIDDEGEPVERSGRLSDRMLPPFANPQQAKFMHNGIVPVDLTLITRARSYDRGFPQFIFDLFIPYNEQGSDYVYAVLTGYDDQDPQMTKNRFFPGGITRMTRPLADNEFSYPKGANGQPVVPQTEAQYAKDVTAFLSWAADPERENRQQTGGYVFLYLLVFLALCLLTKHLYRRREIK